MPVKPFSRQADSPKTSLPIHHSSPLVMKVMEVVLRQGFVHPISFVPTLVALEVDLCEANAKLAHRMMMIMRDK